MSILLTMNVSSREMTWHLFSRQALDLVLRRGLDRPAAVQHGPDPEGLRQGVDLQEEEDGQGLRRRQAGS